MKSDSVLNILLNGQFVSAAHLVFTEAEFSRMYRLKKELDQEAQSENGTVI